MVRGLSFLPWKETKSDRSLSPCLGCKPPPQTHSIVFPFLQASVDAMGNPGCHSSRKESNRIRRNQPSNPFWKETYPNGNTIVNFKCEKTIKVFCLNNLLFESLFDSPVTMTITKHSFSSSFNHCLSSPADKSRG